jgi:hypothetical protein
MSDRGTAGPERDHEKVDLVLDMVYDEIILFTLINNIVYWCNYD